MHLYRRILTRRGAAAPFLLALLGRLPISMAPLGIVLLVQSARDNYSQAGAVTAAFTLAVAIGTPFWGSRLDVYGQSKVLLPLGLVSGGLLIALTLSIARGASMPVLFVLAAGVGLAFPPISPAMRGAWRVLLEADEERRAAFALEGVIIEVVFVAGPLLISSLLLFGPAELPLLITSALLAVGAAGYSLTGAARRWRPEPHADGGSYRGRSPLRSIGVLMAIAVALMVALAFGLLDVSLAATAQTVLGDQKLVGLLFMAVAGGSAIGGTVFGALRLPWPERSLVAVSLTGFLIGAIIVTVLLNSGVRSAAVLMPALFITGLSIAPALIMLANLVDAHADRDRLNEAQGWLSTAFTGGAAAGTAIAGFVVDAGGPVRSFTAIVMVLPVAVLVALLGRRLWRSSGVAEPTPAKVPG